MLISEIDPSAKDGPTFCTRGLAMTMKLAETQLWQRTLASLIRSGFYTRAEVGEHNGLHTVVGIYSDGSPSASLAKYADYRRALDAAHIANYLAQSGSPVESN